MTFTKDSEQEFAGLTLVLKPAATSTRSVPLSELLPAFKRPLVWVPVVARGGVLKVRAVLQQPEFYTELMQAICWEISKHKTVEWQGKICEVTGVEVDSSSLHVLQIPLQATDELPHTRPLAKITRTGKMPIPQETITLVGWASCPSNKFMKRTFARGLLWEGRFTLNFSTG